MIKKPNYYKVYSTVQVANYIVDKYNLKDYVMPEFEYLGEDAAFEILIDNLQMDFFDNLLNAEDCKVLKLNKLATTFTYKDHEINFVCPEKLDHLHQCFMKEFKVGDCFI